jgi:hypothetical protein
MLVAIGTDPFGVELKEEIRAHLTSQGQEVRDLGGNDEITYWTFKVLQQELLRLVSDGQQHVVPEAGTGETRSWLNMFLGALDAAVAGEQGMDVEPGFRSAAVWAYVSQLSALADYSTSTGLQFPVGLWSTRSGTSVPVAVDGRELVPMEMSSADFHAVAELLVASLARVTEGSGDPRMYPAIGEATLVAMTAIAFDAWTVVWTDLVISDEEAAGDPRMFELWDLENLYAAGDPRMLEILELQAALAASGIAARTGTDLALELYALLDGWDGALVSAWVPAYELPDGQPPLIQFGGFGLQANSIELGRAEYSVNSQTLLANGEDFFGFLEFDPL